MKRFFRVLDRLDGIEGALILLLGTTLFIAVVLVLPAALAWELFASGRPVFGGLFLVFIVCASLGVVRDIKHGRFSIVSAALVGIWVISVGFVAVRLWFE